MAFRVGQKVVCVEAWSRYGLGRGDEIGPTQDSIYTIREIGVGLHPTCPDELHVRLDEIVNPVIEYKCGKYEVAFRATRFRPVVERKTDISVFTAMLTKIGADA